MVRWVLLLLSYGAAGQALVLDHTKTHTVVDGDLLSPAWTAGADYGATIALDTRTFVSVLGVPPGVPWCLFARRPNWSPAEAQIRLFPEALSFPPSTPQSGIFVSTPVFLDVGIEMLPVLSGFGEVSQVEIQWLLQDASVLQDMGNVDRSVLWRLVDGGCPP